ncbi:hypothetical protein AAG906_035654 [Vitis piasezkii]
MYGGDDHLEWKRPVSLEACRGLCTVGRYDHFCYGSFKVHPSPFRATLAFISTIVRVLIRSIWVQLLGSKLEFMLLKQYRGHPLIISSLRLHLHRDKWYSFPIENAFESSFPEARRVRIVDCIGTETTTSAYATSDLIDYDLVNLGQPSVTTNPLPAHTTHSVPPSTGDVGHGDMFAPFILWPEDIDVQVMTRNKRIAQATSLVTRLFGGLDSREKVKREDDEILRQL